MADFQDKEIVDLSHVIEEGMVTYKGLPGPHICDFWSRADSAGNYDDGSSFQIGRIDLVANTGTYVDAPFHRFADGKDMSQLALGSLARLPGLIVHRPWREGLGTDADAFAGLDVRGKAVLVHTGWDEHWRTDTYFEGHPYLTGEAAAWLAEQGAALVGIDSHNIDDTRGRTRPVHTRLLGSDIPICEHMRGLGEIGDRSFRLHAVPPKIRGMGTFSVRAYAILD